MGKAITSPVKGWKGTIVLNDPITLPQAIAIEDAQAAIRAMLSNAKKEAGIEDAPLVTTEDFEKAIMAGMRFSMVKKNQILWPVMRACIEEWKIKAFDMPADDSFPASPRERSAEFLSWLYDEIASMFEEPEEEKNE